MGACATKPKADTLDAPKPLPEKVAVEQKEVAVTHDTVTQTKQGEEGKCTSESEEHEKAATQIVESTEVEAAVANTESCEDGKLIPVVSAAVEAEADKENEEVAATDTQETTTVEEKKIEEDEKGVETQKPEKTEEESKEATESEKPATLVDEKTEVKTTES